MIWGTYYLFYVEFVRATVNVLFSITVLRDSRSFLLSGNYWRQKQLIRKNVLQLVSLRNINKTLKKLYFEKQDR